MNGFKVGQHLLAGPKTRDIPIIFISALDDMESKLKAFAAGGVDYATKPFRTNEVLARVNTHLNLRDMQKQLQVGKNILESTADAVSDILILTDLQGVIIRRNKTVASTPNNTYRGLISIVSYHVGKMQGLTEGNLQVGFQGAVTVLLIGGVIFSLLLRVATPRTAPADMAALRHDSPAGCWNQAAS